MADRLVINTGPLIAFERIGFLEIMGQMPYRVVCPTEVRKELDAGEAKGYACIAPAWLAVESLKKPLATALLAGLDRGEAAVIQMAIESEVRTVVIDEWKGRRAARATGLRVVGSLGLLGRAKQIGLIPEVQPYIRKAVSLGVRYHDDLVAEVLMASGEVP